MTTPATTAPVDRWQRRQAWNEALLEVVLPLDRAANQPVLLSCDEADVRTAGTLIGVPESRAAEDFVDAIVGEERLRQRGFADLGSQAARFTGRDVTQSGPPAFFGFCCLLVLAASTMHRDEEARASNYYGRLFRDLLGWQSVPTKELLRPAAIESVFQAVARWTRIDLEGRRGRLEVPTRPYPRWAGIPISQVVFRPDDRVALRRHFERYPRDRELLEHLRASPRHEFLAAARAAIVDEKLTTVVLAAIARARRDARDVRVAPQLRRRPSPTVRVTPAAVQLAVLPRLVLRAFTSGAERPRDLDPGDILQSVPAPEWMSEDRTVRVLLGDPIVFARAAGGALMQVPRPPQDQTCWALTADTEIIELLEHHVDEDATEELPEPWVVLRDIPAGTLRHAAAAPGTAAPTDRITLVAAPRSGRNQWLADDPPRVALQRDDGQAATIALTRRGETTPISTVSVRPGGAERLFAPEAAEPGIYDLLDRSGVRLGRFELLGARTSWPTSSWQISGAPDKPWALTRSSDGPAGALWAEVEPRGRWITIDEPLVGRLDANGGWASVTGTSSFGSRHIGSTGGPDAGAVRVLVSQNDRWLFTATCAVLVDDGAVVPVTPAAKQGVRVWFRGRRECIAVDARGAVEPGASSAGRVLASLRATVVRGLPGQPDGCIEREPSGVPDLGSNDPSRVPGRTDSAGDRVLRWLSGIGDVPLNRWREVCGVLGLDGEETLRQFLLLGHVEFDRVRRRVVAAPPVLAQLTGLGGTWALFGARTPRIESAIKTYVASSSLTLEHVPPSPEAPTAWHLNGPDAAMRELCDVVGVALRREPGLGLASTLPSFRPDTVSEPCDPPSMTRGERYDLKHRRWVESVVDDRPGLWRMRRWGRQLTYVRGGGIWRRVPIDEYGMFVAYPGMAVVYYDVEHELVVTQQDRPLPPLLQRALAMASAELPGFCRFRTVNASREATPEIGIAWPAIPPELARAVAEKIGQTKLVAVSVQPKDSDK
ncbi:hypothetical protein [Patulibacter sp.]|uniref:hypothetical protein n=1 Tax=Patulibacter sp. TaxID=1912859 RepID=UPI00271B1BAF|nr:hypothetical protein [Patulibacter sp.]MDO9410075.1 hypothetical protein [Patulibacter sp.]